MANTIYSSFADPSLAEKAAGALLDFGARAEDISLVGNTGAVGEPAVTPPPVVSSTSGQDYTNRALDDPAGTRTSTARYEDTGGTETWTGDNSAPDLDAERRTYTGSVYGTEPANEAGAIEDYERSAKEGISTTTRADAGAGAMKGLGWGVGVGILAGIASLIVPGVGLVTGGGALATALGGLAATAGAGAVAGAVTGFLKDQGVDEHVAARYEDDVRKGGALLAVTVPSAQVDESTVRFVLEKYGGSNVNMYASRGYVA